ncbi:MAG: hypothetical protein GY785_05325 [Gammaproteobacteria bacterium]|nr:hypothetical protein [Gammaproteobacteria bacterium]
MRYQLKNPCRNGTTHLVFEPLDFLSKLAALVLKPRVNLIRYHGVFAPSGPYRSSVTPAGRGRCESGDETKRPQKNARL